MVLERILLQTIKFDLQVEHPYQFLLRYAKQLKGIAVCPNSFPGQMLVLTNISRKVPIKQIHVRPEL